MDEIYLQHFYDFAVFLTTQKRRFFKTKQSAYDLYISRFHRTNSPFSFFKSIWNSTRPDMHYQIQFFIFFTSLHFILPLRYSNHNALASSGCKNVLISFDSCPLSSRSLRFSSLLLCLCELGLFGGPHKSILRSEGPAPHTERNPPTQCETKTHRTLCTHSLAQIRHTLNERQFFSLDCTDALHQLNSMPPEGQWRQ